MHEIPGSLPVARDAGPAGLADLLSLQEVEVAAGARPPQTASVLGQRVSLPVLVAPTAFQRMAHPDGEVATARASAAAGTLMTLSTWATTTLEEVRAASGGVTRSLVERAELELAMALAGCASVEDATGDPVEPGRP